MSNSPLVTRLGYADPSNYTEGRQQTLRGIVIHHAVATNIDSVIRTFQRVGRGGSAHYCVCDNEVALMVDEWNTAWHCSNLNGNNRTIGIEVCNSTLDPDYEISDASWKTLVKLVADIAKRNGFGRLEYLPDGDGTGITGHKDWQGASTACPGPYLYPRLAQLAKEANDINYPEIVWKPMGTPRNMRVIAGGKLVDIKANATIVQYDEPTDVFMVERGYYNGVTYYRSQYSHDKGVANGFKEKYVTEVPVEPTPEPIPVPEPAPEPEPTPEPQPTPEPIPEPNKSIWQRIIEFIIAIFTRKEK